MTSDAIKKIVLWRRNPVQFVRDVFHVEPDLWQVDFLNNYAGNMRSGAKACKGPGKTAVLSWCAWHFLVCFPHCKIAAVSVTADNLRDNLWAEMSKWQQKSEMLLAAFTWKAERITCNDYPETWWMAARSWSKDADKEKQGQALAGLHADNIMFIMDEAGGIPDAVAATAEAALANAGTEVNPHAVAKLLIAGNPTHLTGPLYRACTSEASLWSMIEITGAPDDPKRSPRINIEWARDQIRKYGATNSWVLVNVFGKFPPASINAMLGPDDMQAAMTRVLPPRIYMNDAKVLGVDVALQGGDATVIAPRQGLACFKCKVIRSDDPKQIAGAVAQAIKKFDPDMVFIDNTGGWGSGVISWLQEWGYSVTGVQFAGKALDPVYFNKRTEMHQEFAAFVKQRGGCLPEDTELKEEACAQTYTHKNDQLLSAPKDLVKETLGRSPDKLDAYSLTFAFPVTKRQSQSAMAAAAAREQEYNPLQGMGGYQPQRPDPGVEYNPLVG